MTPRRPHSRFRTALVLAGLMVLAASARAQFLPGGLGTPTPDKPDDPPGSVPVTVRVEPQGGQAPGHPVVIVAAFQVPEHWYVYEESVKINVAGPEAWAGVDWRLALPAAKTKYDKTFEKDVRYFDGAFDVKLTGDVPPDAAAGEVEIELAAAYQACEKDVCYMPATTPLSATLTVLEAGAAAVAVDVPDDSPSVPPAAQSETDALADEFAESSVIGAIGLSYLVGWGLVLTPCVYPLIPITISLIGAAGVGKVAGLGRSMVYVLGIALVYGALGYVAAAGGGAFGAVVQHPAFYVVLAAVFGVMALGMFGAFTIEMQGSWSARLQQRLRGKAGLAGLLALGGLSGVAAGACVAPVLVGALTYAVRAQSPMLGFWLLFAMAWGMGTPLVILGTFSGLATSLPKSGEWMNTVKHLLGLGLLGAALYFFGKSMLLGEFAFAMLVGATLLVMSVYAGAFDSLSAESTKLDRLRKAFGLLLLVAAAMVFAGQTRGTASAEAAGIEWQVTSEKEALRIGAQDKKPVMLYFWRDNCPACTQLKKKSFTDPAVIAASGDFVRAAIDGSDWTTDTAKVMAERYGFRGFPTVAFVDAQGEVVSAATFVGYVPPEDVLAAIKVVQP